MGRAGATGQALGQDPGAPPATRPARRASLDTRGSGAGTDGLLFVASFLIFAKDYFIMAFGVHVEVIGILLIALLFNFALFRDRLVLRFSGPHLLIIFVLTILWLSTLLIGGVVNVSSYYAAFVVATMMMTVYPRDFPKMMLVIMTVNVGIQLFEAVTGNFLFIYVDDTYEYDEKMLSVGDGALRAKGFFASPLNAISVAMSLAIMNPRRYYPWVLLCITAALGQGRLGIAVGIVGLMALVFSQHDQRERSRLQSALMAVAALAAAGAILVIFGSDQSLQRMSEANSAENSQNLARLYFWTSSIAEILKFDLIQHLVGRFGYIKAVLGGTESDWLRMWLDNGFPFVLVCLLPLLYGWVSAARRGRWVETLAYSLLMAVMAVYPHGQSLPNGILMWLTILATLQRRHHFREISIAR